MSRPIHIVHIIPTLHFGGAERFVIDLANASTGSEFQHSIIVFFHNTPLAQQLSQVVDVHVVEKYGQLSFNLFGKLERKLKEISADVVHTHLFGGDLWGRVAARRLNVPVITTEHALATDVGWFKTNVKQWLVGLSDVYVAPSQAISSFIHHEYHVPTEKIHVIYHGVQLDRFQNISPLTFSDTLRLLTIGRLVYEKGQDIGLSAVARLSDIPLNYRIVGSGKMKEQLILQADVLGIADHVIFEHPITDIPHVFATSDILIVPSRSEGLGLVVIEAMASGRLVIGTRTGGIPELIHDHTNGILVDTDDPIDLARAIRWAHEHKKEVMKLAIQARVDAIAQYGLDKMVKKYEVIYKSLLDNKKLN